MPRIPLPFGRDVPVARNSASGCAASLGPLGAVGGLNDKLDKVVGETIVGWTRGDAHHGFLVQHATDVTNSRLDCLT